MNDEIHDHLITTSFDFGGRDIRVSVTHDGFSNWVDMTPVHSLNKKLPGTRLVAMIFPEDKSSKYVSNLESEHTIKVLVPDDGLRVIREVLSPAYWKDVENYPLEFSQMLDGILEPIFWEDVNPHLSPPCIPPG